MREIFNNSTYISNYILKFYEFIYSNVMQMHSLCTELNRTLDAAE